MKHFAWGLLLGCVSTYGQNLLVGPQGEPTRSFNMSSICPNYTLSTNRSLNEVYLRCPPATQPWVTIRDCANPKVERSADGKYVSINCTKPVKI